MIGMLDVLKDVVGRFSEDLDLVVRAVLI